MTDNIKETKSTGRFASVTKYLRRYKRYLVIGGVSILLTNALALATPYIIKLIIDRLEKRTAIGEVLDLVVLMLGLTVLAGIFRFVVRRTIIWMSRYLEYNLRSELFAHLLRLNPSYYHQTRTGDVMARATNDLEAVRMMIGPGLMHIANTVVSLVFAVGFMLYLSPKLTLYAFVPMIFFPFAVNKLGNLIHRKFVKIQEQFSHMTATAQENLAGMRVIKAYGQEESEINNFSDVSAKYVELNLNMARLQGILFPFIRFLAAGVNLLILAVGGYEIIHGSVDLGTLVAFFTYTNALFWPMFAMGWVVSLYQRGTASLDRINRILYTEPIIRDVGDNLRVSPMQGKIEFRDLTFSYNHALILDGINLTIEPGQTVGIVGMTGSGKTTLVSLLNRLYPVGRGQIFVDDVDINDWQLASLRRQISFATQEPFLFSDTIEENIRFGDGGATQEQVIAAAKAAALAKDIEEFPKHYETLVGERGITLSGGQKQRTAIARALLVEPAVLVLDDATSSVDTETEDEIYERVMQSKRDRTRIIISHRVSSVKEADKIIYLENGRIAEEGNHDELIALNGNYAELYRSQLLEMEIQSLS